MPEDVISIAQKIERKIAELEEMREQILPASFDKAKSISEYDKAIAITILKLKNGVIKEWEGVSCAGLAQSLVPAIAKGICFQQCFDKECGENNYKAILSCIESLKAEMNGYQSINRHLD